MNIKLLPTAFFITALLFVSALSSNAQSNEVFTLTADNLANGKTAELNAAGWKYHAGDDGVWANSNFDDAGWKTLKNSAMTKDSLPQTGWNGNGWLRLRLNVAPALAGVPLNLETAQLGASEIYLDGKLIKRYGSIGSTAATEVGGDYYDFHVGKDGTLTVAVGDATGHGLKAGSVVTATKSLFNAFAKQNDISQILKEMSQALKQMNLRGLFMAMTMLKIKDNQVSLSIAGMPSALIYRRENNQVEEIAIRAMPLGSIAKTNYQEKEFTLEVGDVVVLMSDGFPEMFNVENEMLGFGKAAEILPQFAMNSPQEIINRLVQISEDFANGRAQDDDVTFVVLKVGVNGN